MFRFKAKIVEDGSREAIARNFLRFVTQKQDIFALKMIHYLFRGSLIR